MALHGGEEGSGERDDLHSGRGYRFWMGVEGWA